MGLGNFIRGIRADKVIAAQSGGGKKGGKHRSPSRWTGTCGEAWDDRGSGRTYYPHEHHVCGSTPHTRGDHFCADFDCTATKGM